MSGVAPRSRNLRQQHGRVGDAGSVHVSTLLGVPTVLRDLGFDPAVVLAGLGLSSNLFDAPSSRIPYRSAGALLQRSAELSGCVHFGLLAGRHATAGSLGLLGELVQSSRSVRSALDSLTSHLQLRTCGGVPTHTVEGASATLGYAIYLRDIPGTVQAYDLVMAFAFNIMKAVCGPRWGPTEVAFAHARPPDVQPYREIFGCKLRFDSERTALIFDKAWLDQRPMATDAERHRCLQQQLLALERTEPGDLVDQIRRALRTMVLNGRASERLISSLLSIPTRTLRRMLAVRGTGFRKLLEEVRYEVARQLLTDTDMSTAELAASLHYADASAFSRAFRRWTDSPPAAWRAATRARGRSKSDAARETSRAVVDSHAHR